MDEKQIEQTDLTLVQIDSSGQKIGPIGPNFEILETLGEGAFGIVFKAKHLLLDKVVAIKVLKEEFSSQSKVFLRFQQEARTTSHLSHENIAAVHDFGLTESGHPFIVMDYVEGVTLSALLEERGTLPEEEAIEIFKQICLALSVAHEQGIIHRDLKPSNIILCRSKSGAWLIKVVDFGIAKVLETEENSTSPKLTQTGEIFGTPLYMSPEQCQGQKIDHRSDIYSLGCLMYEALVGRPPFAGSNTLSLLMAQVSQVPEPFSEANVNLKLGDAIERIVFRTLEKEPEARYQSVQALLTDLTAVNRAGTSVPASGLYKAPRQKRARRRVMLVLASLAAMSTLAIFAAVWPSASLTYENYFSPWSSVLHEAQKTKSSSPLLSEGLFRRAIDIATRSHAKVEQLADIKYELACLLTDQQFPKLETPDPPYKIFLEISDLYPENSLIHANCLQYLARLGTAKAFHVQRQANLTGAPVPPAVEVLLRTARENSAQAVTIKIKALGPVHEFVEDAWRSQGHVLYTQGLYSEAEVAFAKALAVAKQLNLADGAIEAARLRDLAHCTRAQGKYEDSKAYYEQAIKKFTNIFGAEHNETKLLSNEYKKYLTQKK